MAKGGARHGAGRPKGSVGDGVYEAKKFVARIEERIKKRDNTHGLETIAENLLLCGDPKVCVVVWNKLVEYKYGKPKESIEHSGQVATVIWDIPRPERERT